MKTTKRPPVQAQGTLRSGWCLTNNHDGCKHVFGRGYDAGVYDTIVCPCDCHGRSSIQTTKRSKA